ncbi:protein DpdH [Bacillus sp. JJ1521]|uniref:protein DpdH n=1 Tax=Bacillus sp. JJ1521 TaxID=3122957 RepID=UPI002FFE2890
MAQTMKGYVCWNEDVIGRVLETETEEVLDHIFLASHTPIRMYRELNSSIAESSLVPYSESQFLEDFLKRDNYMFATVLGDVGTGKTHLIRWLSARIPRNDRRKVVLIPRFGTNLRKIISLILDGMEGSQFDEYRQKLKRVDEELTPESARETLLGNLAIAIGPNGPHKDRELTEEEEYMRDMLPALFHDPFFRKILLADGGIIHAITDHVIGAKKKIERMSHRRRFTIEDLPTNITDLEKASSDARTIYAELLDDEELKEDAVNWINKHIDSAIIKMLNLQGGDLVDMINDVRAELKKEDIELVLLFEDFAATEGIDTQLIKALLIRPNAAKNATNKELCNMRIAIACTTGYYEDLRDTVQTRVELKVSLDVVTGDMYTSDDMESFVSRYLNVLRYSDREIIDWYNEMLSTGVEKELPSACEKRECPFIDKCHGSFGNSSDKGLYPFNKQAIITMYSRLFKEDNPKFNPRTMIKDVIRRTLEDYTNHIRTGIFPPPSMFQRFGEKTKNRLSALEINKLTALDTVSSDRREVLLEFWTNSEEIVNLPKTIHEAFNFSVLDSVVSVEDENEHQDGTEHNNNPSINVKENNKKDENRDVSVIDGKKGSNSLEQFKDKLPEGLLDQIQQIETWKNDGSLRQNIMQTLRESVYSAINDYIDWDSELLHLGSLKDEGIWRPKFIHFERSTTITPSIVQLVLPLGEETLNDTAIVLQAILYYQYYKHWKFEKGSQYYRYFTRYIHRWGKHVLSQINHLKSKNNQTIPVVSIATETLAIGSLLSGRSLGNNPVKSIDSLFYPLEEASHYRSVAWKRLQEEIKQNEKEIKEHLFSRIGIFKGQTKPFKLIDSSKLLYPLSSLVKGEFSSNIITETISEFSKLVKTYRHMRETFESVIEEELTEKRQWLAEMEAAFGQDLNIKEALVDLRKAMESAGEDGSLRGVRDRDGLSKLANEIEVLPLIELGDCIKEILQESNTIKKAEMLGNLDTESMFKVKSFVESTSRFLQESLRSVEKDIIDLEQDQKTKGLATVTEDIKSQFDLLIDVMNKMKRGDSNDSNESKIISSTH